MAKIDLTDPVAVVRGRLSADAQIVFRTRNGRTHAYVIEHPKQTPQSEKQRTHFALFGEVAKQTRAEMADLERRAYWEKEFAAYTKKHNPPSRRAAYSNGVPTYQSANKPPISTLFGYIFHTLYTQAQSSAQQ